MSALLLPFARHIQTGRTVAPEEVKRGNACDCECLFCGAPVQARHCNVKANHFAHQAKVVDEDNPCPACFERCVFWMTKRILEEGTNIALPEYTLELVDYIYGVRRSYLITKEKVHRYELVDFPDISTSQKEHISIVISISGHPLRLIMSYEKYLRELKEPSVHISLDYLSKVYKAQKKGFLNAMRALILESLEAKTWLYHSKDRNGKRERDFKKAVEDAKAKEDARRDAQRRENRLLVARKKQRSNLIVTQHSCSGRKALVLKRLELLLSIARKEAQTAHFGWQCTTCFVVSSVQHNRCTYCGSTNFSICDLSPEAMSSMYTRFSCGNYAGRSLDAVPELVIE